MARLIDIDEVARKITDAVLRDLKDRFTEVDLVLHDDPQTREEIEIELQAVVLTELRKI